MLFWLMKMKVKKQSRTSTQYVCFLVAEMKDQMDKFSLVKNDLIQINVLRQRKLSAMKIVIYVKIRVND